MVDSKNFIRLVDEDGFETRLDSPDDQYWMTLMRVLKVGTKIQARLDGWFGLDGEIVDPDKELPE